MKRKIIFCAKTLKLRDAKIKCYIDAIGSAYKFGPYSHSHKNNIEFRSKKLSLIAEVSS